MPRITYQLLLLLGLVASAVGQELALFGLDARLSQILRIAPATGEIVDQFSSPVLCRPEGACGLAYSGHSLFFVDATDPDRRIYEFNPAGHAVWHSFPAPGGKVDGLAYVDGTVLALSFDEDRVYRVDPFDGTVLDQVDLGVDLVGGLAAGGGKFYASRIRPPVLYEIDAASGEILTEIDAAGSLPTGLALVGGRLYAGDFTGQRILEFDVGTGVLVGEQAGISGRFSALAGGAAAAVVPYVLRIEPVAERLAVDGRVELVVRGGIYDREGRLMHTNDHTQILFAVLGGAEQAVQVAAGEAEAVFVLDPGSVVEVEARVAGLAAAAMTRRIVAPATQMTMHFTEVEPRLIEVSVELIDGTGALAIEDTSAVSFAVLRGLGAVVGPEVVSAREAQARTWVLAHGRDTDLVVAAQVRSVVHSGGYQVSAFANRPAADAGGLAVSAMRVGGRDQFPPAPPTGVQAQRQEGQVEIRWTLSEDDGAQVWFEFGGRRVRRRGVDGYRIYRSADGAFYEEIGRVGPGGDRYVDATAADGAVYRYKVLAEDQDNWREVVIAPGSAEDLERTVAMAGAAQGVDAAGQPVYGLFDDDLDVDFDDFFLFADHFGRADGDAAFDARFDLDGDGAVDFDDFFLVADHFGQVAVSR